MARVNNGSAGRQTAAKKPNRRPKRRKKNHAIGLIILLLVLLGAGVVLSLTVFFEIEAITCVGVDKYSPQDVIAKSGINIGDNMFRIDTQAVEKSIINEFPYIDTVKIKPKLPHEVRLEITQCKPAAALVVGDEYMIMTRDGKILEQGEVYIPEDVMIVKGIEVGDAKPGDYLGADANEAMIMLDYLYAATKESNFYEITNVDLSDIYNMKINFEDRLLFNLGTESDLVDKLNFVKEVIDNRLPKDVEGIVDASDINRSLIFTEMPIDDAKLGRQRPDSPKKRGQPATKAETQEEQEIPIVEANG